MIAQLYSQSHHAGIETKKANKELNKDYASQSHHAGIETRKNVEQADNICSSQSHHAGIETDKIGIENPNFSSLPIAPCWN